MYAALALDQDLHVFYSKKLNCLAIRLCHFFYQNDILELGFSLFENVVLIKKIKENILASKTKKSKNERNGKKLMRKNLKGNVFEKN